MKNKTFRVQSPNKIGVGGNWYLLMRCQEHTGITVHLHPTLETKKNIPSNYHEWDVPDNEYNRNHIARYMPDYKIIDVSEKKPEPKKAEPKKADNPAEGKKLNPMQVKELKSKVKEELDSAGVKYPKTASLSELQKLASTNK